MIEEAAEAAGVSAQALERRLKELGVRPVYTRKRPSEEGGATKAKKSSNEIAILGPYVLTKARRGKSNFVLRGELALELAYNLYEAGVITGAKLAEVEEVARGRVVWYVSVGRLTLMELGAEFVEPEDKPKDKGGMSEKQKKGESRRMSETRERKSREEIRKEIIMEFIRLNNIADPDILAALAEELGYRARRTRWTIRGR